MVVRDSVGSHPWDGEEANSASVGGGRCKGRSEWTKDESELISLSPQILTESRAYCQVLENLVPSQAPRCICCDCVSHHQGQERWQHFKDMEVEQAKSCKGDEVKR